MKTFFKTVIQLATVGMFCSCATTYYTNPVINTALPDPTVIRLKETYYAAGTTNDRKPVFPIFTSKDLVNWTPAGHVFQDFPDWTVGSFWAPEFYQIDGKTYCYYTARRKADNISCIGVAIADSPTSKFVDHGMLLDWGKEAIDSYIFDDQGQLYIIWKAYGLNPERPIELLAQKLSADGLHVEGEVFSLLQDIENIGMEGQCIFKEGDYYYLLYSARDCCSERSDYEVRVARSKSFRGPYEKYTGNPILKGDGKYIQSCGHGTMVRSKTNRMYYLCHAFLVGKHHEGRKPILQEMVVGKDQWIHFLTGNITQKNQRFPR